MDLKSLIGRIAFVTILTACSIGSPFNPGETVFAKGGAGAFTAEGYELMNKCTSNGDKETFKMMLFTDQGLTLGRNDKYTVVESTSEYTIVQDHAGRRLYVRNDLLSKHPF